MRKPLIYFTHDQIMNMLPMGSAYLMAEDGYPCNVSLSLAIMLQGLVYVQNPYKLPETHVN